MSELTPKRIRDARETVRQVFAPFAIGSAACQVLDDLLKAADELEREQAEEAKRFLRAEELAIEIYRIESAFGPHAALNVARALLDHYPALAEGPES